MSKTKEEENAHREYKKRKSKDQIDNIGRGELHEKRKKKRQKTKENESTDIGQNNFWPRKSGQIEADPVEPADSGAHDLQSREVVGTNGNSSDETSSAKEKISKADLKALRKAEKKELKRLKKLEEEPQSASHHISSTSDQSETVKTEDSGYSTMESLTSLPHEEIKNFLTSNSITVSDPKSQGFRPILDFAFLPSVLENETEIFKAFKTPTPIQASAWPFLLAGRDAVGIAETGSGKTLAFGLPCVRYVNSLSKDQKKKRPVKALIVSPTRELAMQIFEHLQRLVIGTNTTVTCIYGGVQKDDQRESLKKSNIIVATPGRLNDFINEGSADLSSVGYLVLDEADRMLDKGFEEEVKKIIKQTPAPNCQTLMFTATWPPSIRELAASFMQDPVKITIGEPTSDLRANTRVTQKVEVIDPRGKEFRLLQLLKQYQSGSKKNDKILVFCLYKKEATRVENLIRNKGYRVAGIHGDMNQSARTASLEAFKSGKVPLLVATDVAARGLDIPSVKLVLNVTFPLTAEDYVHRIGRTGRAGQSGLAITLFTEHDKAQSGALINVLKAANQEVPADLMKFGTTVKKKVHEQYGAFYREAEEGSKKATKITFD